MERSNESVGSVYGDNELSYLEKIIDDRMEKDRNGDTEFIKYYQSEIFKSVVEALNSQISLLIENVNHLREETKNKNNIINHLMGIITTFQINQTTNEQSTFNLTNESQSKECNDNDKSISNYESNTSTETNIQNDLNDVSSKIINIDRGLHVTHTLEAHHNSNLTISDQRSINETLSDTESVDNEEIPNELYFDNDIYYIKDFYDYKLSDEQMTDDKNFHNDAYNSHVEGKSVNLLNNINTSHKWKKGTVLIASDSMLNKIDERRLGKHNYVKVRTFPGSVIRDFYSYLTPLLLKAPTYVVLHVSTNDCVTSKPNIILNELLNLKKFIEEQLPDCTVIISEPVIRTDNIVAANNVREVGRMLRLLNIYMLDNCNIEPKHLGKGGLHLNDYGTKRMALNLITLLRNL